MACFRRSTGTVCLLMLAAACGGRTGLEDGPGSGPAGGVGAGASGAGASGAGAGLSTYDPDVECPVVGCGESACPPAVLTEGRTLGWATVDGGDLYFTTNDAEGDNALMRVPVCGGEPVVLLERERFAGEGLIVGDYLYIPAEEPAREVLRLPKIGGAATAIHTHKTGDPYTTRAIGANKGYLLLSQYSFDGGLTLKEINPKGKAHQLHDNLPDEDWTVTMPAAILLSPNKPLFFDPTNGEPYAALIGSDLGVFRVSPYNGQAGDPVFIAQLNLEHRVFGPLLSTGGSEADLVVYFSSNEDFESPVHWKLTGGSVEPILTENGGVMVALDGGEVVGTSNHAYTNEFEEWELGGDVWQAALTDPYGERVFTTEGQNTLGVELHGASVYVRTTRAVLRFPRFCKQGDERCLFSYE